MLGRTEAPENGELRINSWFMTDKKKRVSPVLISYDHPIHIYNLVSSELTVDLVCSPSVGYVQLLFPIEQAEIDFSVALHRILEPFRLRVDPLFRAQTGDKQCHRDARAEERQKNHTAFEQIHFSSCPTVRLRREHRTVFFYFNAASET